MEDIREIAREIVRIRSNFNYTDSRRLDLLCLKFRNRVFSSESTEDLYDILELDNNEMFPFEEKQLVYEKLICLDGNATIISKYINWLSFVWGPDFEFYIDYLKRKIKK